MVKYWDGLDAVATALANGGRRRIVDRLRAGPATTSELAAMLQIGLPAATKQLAALAEARLVQSTKTGRTVTHRLDPAPLMDFSTWLATRESFWQHQLDALSAHLQERP